MSVLFLQNHLNSLSLICIKVGLYQMTSNVPSSSRILSIFNPKQNRYLLYMPQGHLKQEIFFLHDNINNGYFHKLCIFSLTIFKTFALPYEFCIWSEWIIFLVTILGKYKHSVHSKHYLSLGNYKFQQVCRDTTIYFLEWLKLKKNKNKTAMDNKLLAKVQGNMKFYSLLVALQNGR